MSEQDHAGLVESFQNAALGLGSWSAALDALAAATGCMGGELIGLGAEAAVPFNWMTGVAPEAAAEFLDVGGGDPRVNSRVRIGARAPELAVLDENAFTTAQDARRRPEYGEWIRRHDVPFVCLSPLLRQDELLVGLAVMRGRRQGQITSEEKRIFTALAPHVRAAVRTQMVLEAQGVALLADLLGAVSKAAFVCDGSGRVHAVSPPADRLLSEGRWLRVRGGRLAARNDADTVLLLQTLAAAAAARTAERRPPAAIVVRDETGSDPLPLEASAIPGEHALRFGATVLLIARPPREADRRAAELARVLYGLTGTEAAVAAGLVAGLGPAVIADQTGVSVGTVRSHIRRIFEKARVNSQLELVAAISARL